MIEEQKTYRVFSLLLVASYGWIGYNLYSFNHPGKEISLCLFKNITGLPCPACGTTRAILQLIHLNIQNSIFINPLATPILCALLVAPFWLITDAISKKTGFLNFYIRLERIISSNRAVQAFLIALLLTNWGWNIYKGL